MTEGKDDSEFWESVPESELSRIDELVQLRAQQIIGRKRSVESPSSEITHEEVSNQRRKVQQTLSLITSAAQGKATTTVVRLKRKENGPIIQGCDVYIGRRCFRGGWELPASRWANPFTVMSCGGSNEKAVAKYEEYLLNNKSLMAALPELKGKVLGCWCAPAPCHGNVLAKYANALP